MLKKAYNSVKDLWRALDGRKTFIGAVLLSVYFLGVEHGVWASDGTVEAVLQFVFGVGVGHKAVKKVR